MFKFVAMIAVVISAGAAIQPAQAQSKARIYNVELGKPVSALPTHDWVNPSCGTNGGPPSTRLASFAEFARCRPEAATGLHEVWFIYDDEWEYIARAYGDPAEITRYAANVFYSQPIITSLLIDGAGIVQGYRIITDPRADNDLRREAHTLNLYFRNLVSGGKWTCVDLPAADRELPVYGEFIKSDCSLVTETVVAMSQGRLLQKPGQNHRDVPGLTEDQEGNYESQARLQVIRKEAVAEAPCCKDIIAAGPSGT